MKGFSLSLLLVAALPLLIACNNDPEESPGRLTLHVNHYVSGNPLQFDQLLYTNAAGNHYEVSEIQWFISDITLVNDDGETLLLDGGGFAHYVDTDLPQTWTWELPDRIPAGNYSSIKFTFGLKGEKNVPYSFPNPPESDMAWPYMMGGDQGGYHYMKLNGFWINTDNQRTPFNAHLGVGQEYDNEGNVTAFIQNWFQTELPQSAFKIMPGETKEITLTMNVESWFETPYVYDLDAFGGMIMKNQEAMQTLRDNGKDAFSCKFDNTP